MVGPVRLEPPAGAEQSRPRQQRFPILRTARLTLRELAAEDVADVMGLYSNPEVTRYCEMVTLDDPRQAAEVIRVFRSDWDLAAGVRWGLGWHDTSGLLGICGLGWHHANRSALLSYDLSQSFWNQGIMTEAVRAVVRYAFEETGVNRLTATTVLHNPASVRVLHHAGFREEGILRAWAYWKGEFNDLRCFSLLRQDPRAY